MGARADHRADRAPRATRARSGPPRTSRPRAGPKGRAGRAGPPLTGPGPERGPVGAYLAELAARTRGLLAPDLAGVYVIGSLAMGGYVPGRSDVDVAVVTSRPVARPVLRRLVERLAHPGLPCPAPKLELVVYPRAALAGERPALAWGLNLNTGPEVGLDASFDPGSLPSHWFVLDVAMARDHARPVLGPPPRQVFAELDRPRVLAALADSLRWHREHDRDGRSSVLNACRALRFVTGGRWSSKVEAAAWAAEHGPDPGIVRAAARGDHGLDRPRVAAFLGAVERAVLTAPDAEGGARRDAGPLP